MGLYKINFLRICTINMQVYDFVKSVGIDIVTNELFLEEMCVEHIGGAYYDEYYYKKIDIETYKKYINTAYNNKYINNIQKEKYLQITESN